jgi:hypothetical protein
MDQANDSKHFDESQGDQQARQMEEETHDDNDSAPYARKLIRGARKLKLGAAAFQDPAPDKKRPDTIAQANIGLAKDAQASDARYAGTVQVTLQQLQQRSSGQQQRQNELVRSILKSGELSEDDQMSSLLSSFGSMSLRKSHPTTGKEPTQQQRIASEVSVLHNVKAPDVSKRFQVLSSAAASLPLEHDAGHPHELPSRPSRKETKQLFDIKTAVDGESEDGSDSNSLFYGVEIMSTDHPQQQHQQQAKQQQQQQHHQDDQVASMITSDSTAGRGNQQS